MSAEPVRSRARPGWRGSGGVRRDGRLAARTDLPRDARSFAPPGSGSRPSRPAGPDPPVRSATRATNPRLHSHRTLPSLRSPVEGYTHCRLGRSGGTHNPNPSAINSSLRAQSERRVGLQRCSFDWPIVKTTIRPPLTHSARQRSCTSKLNSPIDFTSKSKIRASDPAENT